MGDPDPREREGSKATTTHDLKKQIASSRRRLKKKQTLARTHEVAEMAIIKS